MFTGKIPATLMNNDVIASVKLHNNLLTGCIADFEEGILKKTYIDFTNNQLIGEVPNSIKNKFGVDRYEFNLFDNIDNQIIGIGDAYPDKFKVDLSLKGNLIEGLSNQKEIVINDVNSISLDTGSKLSVPTKYKNVSVVWNGNIEDLSSSYKLEYYIDDSDLFDSKLYATEVGNTTLRAKIVGAESSNTNAISSNGYDITINKKYVPLKMTLSQDIKTWTSNDAIITVTTIGSEDLEYILLPDGSKIEDGSRTCEFAADKNGTYEFTAKTVTGEEVTSKIVVKYVDKDGPTMTISERADSDGNVTLTVKAADSGAGVKSITTPDGKTVNSATTKYDVVGDGEYKFIATDKVGNTSEIIYTATGLVLDDTWLAKEVARQVKKKVEDLTVEDFEKITTINLSNKNIKGKIPDYIGLLTNVTVFKVNGNSIAGTIPDEIGNMTNLKTLWLTDNRLTGNIPSSIGNLENLEELDLGLNFLDGSVPSELGNLPKIKGIYLCENKLTGEIPAELGNLDTLTTLCLDFNNLTGTVPKGVMSLRVAKNFEGNQLNI